MSKAIVERVKEGGLAQSIVRSGAVIESFLRLSSKPTGAISWLSLEARVPVLPCAAKEAKIRGVRNRIVFLFIITEIFQFLL